MNGLLQTAAFSRLREADHRLGLVESLASQLSDPRNPDKIRDTLGELIRERVYGMAQGYSAQDDADRLAHDPAFKIAVWDRKGGKVIQERLASQPTQSRLVDILRHAGNREALRGSLAEWTNQHLRAAGGDRPVRQATIDIDSLISAVPKRCWSITGNGAPSKIVWANSIRRSACISRKQILRKMS